MPPISIRGYISRIVGTGLAVALRSKTTIHPTENFCTCRLLQHILAHIKLAHIKEAPMLSSTSTRWFALIVVIAFCGVALAYNRVAVNVPLGSDTAQDTDSVPFSAAPTRQLSITALPALEPGETWRSFGFVLESDAILPNGLRFQVTDGVVTAVVTRQGTPNYQILGTRYVPGDLDATDVTRALWRHLDLELTKPDGSKAKLQVGRPMWWLEETGAKEGASIDLSMHEVGIEGSAQIVRIGPFDADSREGDGKSNLVIGKIEHENALVWNLVFNNDGKKPLGVTANHPLFSHDRDEWVPAGELKIGEKLRTANGLAQLTAKTQRPGLHKVYNIEVHRSHSYHVSQFGILAHNTGIGCNVARTGQEISRTTRKVGEKVDFFVQQSKRCNELGSQTTRLRQSPDLQR